MTTTKKPNCDSVRECVTTYRDLMEGLIESATQISKEIGMSIYINKRGKCTIGDICTGDRCNVKLKYRSRSNGSFHVHSLPKSVSYLSYVDISTSYNDRHSFACVGSKKHGIKCFMILNTHETKELSKMSNHIIDYIVDDMAGHFKEILSVIAEIDPKVLYSYEYVHRIESIKYLIKYEELPYAYIPESYEILLDFIGYIIKYLFEHIEEEEIEEEEWEEYGSKESQMWKVDQLNEDMENTHGVYLNIIEEAETFLETNKSKIVQECKLS